MYKSLKESGFGGGGRGFVDRDALGDFAEIPVARFPERVEILALLVDRRGD